MDGQAGLMNLLADADHWQVKGIRFEGQAGCLSVELRAKRQACACPGCQQASVHGPRW
jgi:hypothetical protein